MEERMQRLLREKMKQIHRYLLRLGANPADAEDIVQDAMYKGFLYIDSIAPDKFSAWLFRVAVNGYYDHCRKRKRRVEISLDDLELPQETETDAPDERVLQRERREEIDQALEDLKPLFKQLLVMKYKMELTYQEIGSLLDLKESAVKTYLHRARKQFEKVYGRDRG
ncbi:MAG TPA: RNA polymerase sigma factor [Bacilli bacterium]|nr:RNA polymerase sigma factor [Bacilli bacterium]